MEFYRIKSDHEALFKLSYELYQNSFPLHEQRQPHHQSMVLADPAYHFEAIIEDGEPTGIIGYWLIDPAIKYIN